MRSSLHDVHSEGAAGDVVIAVLDDDEVLSTLFGQVAGVERVVAMVLDVYFVNRQFWSNHRDVQHVVTCSITEGIKMSYLFL